MIFNSKCLFLSELLVLFLVFFGFASSAYSDKVVKGANIEEKDSPVGKMVLIKGGCFKMGDAFGDGNPDEKPVHKVCVDDFYLGEHEVTQREWEEIMGNNPSYFKNCGEDCPVENVSWNDVQEFMMKLNKKTGMNYRLPREAEWEYGAREGGKEIKFPGFSSRRDLELYSNFCDVYCEFLWKKKNQDDGFKYTAPVKSFKPNGLGLYDMSGNVWEWAQDWYDKNYYNSIHRKNPGGPIEGKYKVLRGGSWGDEPALARAAGRFWSGPELRNSAYGFRLARDKNVS